MNECVLNGHAPQSLAVFCGILHQISELMLCSKQETQCIENLVVAVTTNLFAFLGVLLPTPSSPVADTAVGLHLIALMFTRCRFVCAQMVHKYSLVSVLTALLTGDVDTLLSHPLPVLLNVGESSSTPSSYVGSQSLAALEGKEDLFMLAAIILDQYERAVGAIRLRKKAVELYKDCHSWSCGATRAQWSIDRNRYAIEFPTMTQVNLSSSTTQMTDYESMLLNMESPEGLSTDLRRSLCLALLRRFDRPTGKPLSAECLNSFLRLLLRLTASSFDDAETVANADCLRILFTLSHPFEFSSQYSAFIFDDPSTVTATLQQILNKFAEGVCSSCRDLFYLLSLCAPLVAKAEDLAIRLMKETFSLVVDEKSIEDGVPPKSFSIANPLETSANDVTVDLSPELNSRQKHIVVFIIEALVKPPTPASATVNAPAQTPDGWSHAAKMVEGNNMSNKPISGSEAQSHGNNPEEPASLYVGLSKLDYLRYLVDLAITSRKVAEFIAKYTVEGVKGTGDRSSFVSYLLTTELREQANMDLTVLLLETLVFNTCLPTQSAIISEFKSSLRDIAAAGLALLNDPDEGHKRNQRIIAHMRFLDQLLFLPPPISLHVIKQIYKRQIPCDITKLLALANCNLTNTQQTLNFIVKVLEILTESVQHNRADLPAPGRQQHHHHQQQHQQRHQNYVTVMTTVADDLHSATETANPVISSLAPSVEGEPMLAMEHVDITESRSPEESSSTADIHAQASDLSFSDSVFSRGDIVVHSLSGLQDLSRQGMRQSSDTWALAETASDQDDSDGGNTENGLLILDDDEEDEGSAGQGGETDNSQDGGEEDVEDRRNMSGSTRRRNSDSFDRYSIEDDDDREDHSGGRSLNVFSRNRLSPILGATESMMFGSHAATFSGGGALSVAQTNALQNLQLTLPAQHPLLQSPHSHYPSDDVPLRNGGSSAGGFSNPPAPRHQPFVSTPNVPNNLTSSRDGPVISILLPSSRVAVSGSSSTNVRFGRSNPAAQLPLVLRTSFNRQRLTAGGSGATAAAVIATPSVGGSGLNRRPYEVYNSGSHSSTQRNRRRGNAPQATLASSSQPSAQHSQQEADALAWEMLSNEFRERLAAHQASVNNAVTPVYTTTEATADNSGAAAQVPSLLPSTEEQPPLSGSTDDRYIRTGVLSEWAPPRAPDELASDVVPQASMEHQGTSQSDLGVTELFHLIENAFGWSNFWGTGKSIVILGRLSQTLGAH
ncbi:unnamed protein product [Dibothriocephalus latus]|uniref:Uncharacterized protein n=1 Tax=Dibothriocephalus latus TaxID=60516 RepID=A0A3P7M0V6_DIBLA|nr:unnamed protein product [Dibothriocephalus latus]